jgi:outer membrane protein assembly factor BamB
LPLTWSEEENVVWKTAVEGRAWSTPAVVGEQVWLTNATDDGTAMSGVCLDFGSGEVLFDKVLFRNATPEPLGNPVNGYASPSPAVEDGRAYLHFGSYGTACLDTEKFEVVWERRDLPCRHFRGPGSSPVLWGDLLVLTMDGVDVQYLVALDKATGKTVWRTDRTTAWTDLDEHGQPKAEGDFRKAYTTPLFLEVAGKTQMVSSGAMSAFAYDPATGEELWKVVYGGFSNASSPVAGAGLLFLNSGFGEPETLALRVDGQMRGEITESHGVWKTDKRQPKKPSPVFANGHLFVIEDAGIVSCFHPGSPEPLFEERISGKFSASPVASGDRIYIPNEQNTTYVLAAEPGFRVLAENKLEAGCLASPAVAGDSLLLRTPHHVYRIAEKP